MKTSNYNAIRYHKGYAYWYNFMTLSHFKINTSLSKKIEDIINNGDFAYLPESTLIKLKGGGFIIEDSFNELDYLRSKYAEAVNNKNYFLVILPTLNCNYSCWYCIQTHIPSKMSLETISAIKEHIKNMVEVEKIDSPHLDWFGGEPFLYFSQVIQPISEYAMEICHRNNTPFLNSATTNGFFLKREIHDTLGKLCFKQFQITLDGNREFHDKVKFTKSCDSTFVHVLKNIDSILKIDGMRVFLRINYTHDNLTHAIVEQINAHISPHNRAKVIIMPRKVWQKKADKTYPAKLEKILQELDNSGYTVSRITFCQNNIPCYVNKKYYNAINFNGEVVKCTAGNDLYGSDHNGQLNPDGNITWPNNYDLKVQSPSFENETCLSCKHLPLCMGDCPRNYLAGSTGCKYDRIDETLEEQVFNYVISQY